MIGLVKKSYQIKYNYIRKSFIFRERAGDDNLAIRISPKQLGIYE